MKRNRPNTRQELVRVAVERWAALGHAVKGCISLDMGVVGNHDIRKIPTAFSPVSHCTYSSVLKGSAHQYPTSWFMYASRTFSRWFIPLSVVASKPGSQVQPMTRPKRWSLTLIGCPQVASPSFPGVRYLGHLIYQSWML